MDLRAKLLATDLRHVQAWRGDDDRLYIDVEKADLLEELLDPEAHWPIPIEDIRTVVTMEISRRGRSEELAIEVAYCLATKLNGEIAWDDVGLERAYRRFVQIREQQVD